jgi:hypothetical protein
MIYDNDDNDDYDDDDYGDDDGIGVEEYNLINNAINGHK